MSTIRTLLIVPILTAGLMGTSAAYDSAKLSPGLVDLADAADQQDSLISVVVFLDDHSGNERAAQAASARAMSRDERIRNVLQQLSSARPTGADAVESFLNTNAVSDTRRFWIVPAYAAEIPARALSELSNLTSVRRIVPDVTLAFDPPVAVQPTPQLSAGGSAQLQLLGVPTLWQQGLTGKGRLVCSFDTGVDGDHPALAPKWRGAHAELSASWFSPVAPNSIPDDAAGHGSHTMGIMVGSTPTDTFGVAPDAEWITAGVVDQGRSLSVTLSDILAAFQWALNPDGNPATTDDVPDVILNSWGVPAGLFSPCEQTFWAAIDAVEAAGIVTIFAAGNEGPDPRTIRNPASRATTPLNSFSVGAVDNSKEVASFSSRGPGGCGTDAIKPEVVAPGVAVYSTSKDGGYAYMSGTSMAAPYIAGLVALCRQYNPDLTVTEIKEALIASAEDLGTPGEDNDYGHGLVDATRLIQLLAEPSGVHFAVRGEPQLNIDTPLPGDTVMLSVGIELSSGEAQQVRGRLVPMLEDQVNVLQAETDFFFDSGSLFSVGSTPMAVELSPLLQHGTDVALTLELTDNYGMPLDSVSFSFVAGIPAPGTMTDHVADDLTLTVSDFGQYGFAPGSQYNLGQTGLRSYQSDNILYEAGIILGAPGWDLSSAVRDENGRTRLSDFSATSPLSAPIYDDDGAVHYKASLRDKTSSFAVPVLVEQESIHFSESDLQGAVALKYRVQNLTGSDIQGFSFGLLTDFDQTSNEHIVSDPVAGITYQQIDGGYVGIVSVAGFQGGAIVSNGFTKTGFSDDELLALVTETHQASDSSLTGDGMILAASGGGVLTADSANEYMMAFVTARSIDELYSTAESVRLALGRTGPVNGGEMPTTFVLNQNYPNPFNPSTTISFGLPAATRVQLTIYNSLGQQVRVLVDKELEAGFHQIEWDATSNSGSRVASGVYFYRVQTSESVQSRKMVLLK